MNCRLLMQERSMQYGITSSMISNHIRPVECGHDSTKIVKSIEIVALNIPVNIQNRGKLFFGQTGSYQPSFKLYVDVAYSPK